MADKIKIDVQLLIATPQGARTTATPIERHNKPGKGVDANQVQPCVSKRTTK